MSSSQPRSDTNYDSTSAGESRSGSQFASLHQRHPQYFSGGQQQGNIINNNNNNRTLNSSNNGNIGSSSATGGVPAYQRQSATMNNNNNMIQPGGGQDQLPIRPSKRLALQTPEVRATRAHWQILLWVPFLLLQLHKQNEIAASTNGIVTVTSAMTTLGIFAPLLWYNEYQDGYRFPIYIFAMLSGFVWGTIREVIANECDFWVRPAVVLWFSFVAAKLRVNRDVKRISAKRNQHVPLYHKIWNFIERNVGISAFFFVSEVLSVLAQPGGLGQLLDGAFGTLAFLSSPVVAIKLGQWMLIIFSRFADWIPGASEHHSDATKARRILTILAMLISTFAFFFLMAGFISSYLPFIWTHDQFIGAYLVIFEVMVFNQQKDEARSQRRQNQQVLHQQQQQFGGR